MTKAILIGLIAALAASVAAEALFAPPHHPVFPWHVAGLYAGVGLGASVLLTFISKGVAAAGLQRRESDGDDV